MPRHYSTVFSEEDIQKINTHNVKLNLVYKWYSSKSNSYILCIESNKTRGCFYYCVLEEIRWILGFLFMLIWHWAKDCVTILVLFYVTGSTTNLDAGCEVRDAPLLQICMSPYMYELCIMWIYVCTAKVKKNYLCISVLTGVHQQDKSHVMYTIYSGCCGECCNQYWW
jgi:hypothetical protein